MCIYSSRAWFSKMQKFINPSKSYRESKMNSVQFTKANARGYSLKWTLWDFLGRSPPLPPPPSPERFLFFIFFLARDILHWGRVLIWVQIKRVGKLLWMSRYLKLKGRSKYLIQTWLNSLVIHVRKVNNWMFKFAYMINLLPILINDFIMIHWV